MARKTNILSMPRPHFLRSFSFHIYFLECPGKFGMIVTLTHRVTPDYRDRRASIEKAGIGGPDFVIEPVLWLTCKITGFYQSHSIPCLGVMFELVYCADCAM